MPEKSPSQALLDRLAEANVPKGVIAKKLVVQPSAVTELYKGNRRLSYDEADKLMELIPASARNRDIPVIGLAGAGNWLEAVEHPRETITVPAQLLDKARFAVEVSGQSMNLLLPEGSIAVVDPDDRDLYVGRLYLLRNHDGEATIKRYRADPARFEPVSDDPSYLPFSIGAFDFQVIGRVTLGMQRF